MFFLRQEKLSICLNSILVLLTVFCVNTTYAQQLGTGASVNMRKLDKRAAVEAYKVITSTAIREFMKHLTNPSDTDTLEKLVVMSNDYIAKYPTSERVSEVNYYLGKALVQLGRFETGISIFEKLIETVLPNHIAMTRYADEMGDVLRWKPHERGLLELGLAYDKQNQYDKADAVYRKLITHPKFSDGLQAGVARQILELDIALRIGEVPTTHVAWIGRTAPNFRMRHGEGRRQSISLKRYEGQVVLLCYGASDMLNLNLAQLHDKYRDQKFQIITVNADVSEPPMTKPMEMKDNAWIHYQDTYGKVVDLFQIGSLPALFLMDSEGVVRKTHLDATPLEKAVDELVKKNLAKYDDPRTQEIVAKAVEAHGGLEKLKPVENIVMNMRFFEHFPDGSSEEEGYGKVYYYPNKYRTEFHTNEGEQYIQLFDGTSLYMSEDGKFEQIPHEEAKHAIDRHKDRAFSEPIWLLSKLSDNKIPVQYVGTENVKGVPASILRVRQPSGRPLKIFISEKTHLIVQFEFGNGRVNTVIGLEQYRDVDGIKISHYSISKNESHHETSLTNINLNVEIDPELFDPK